jgi:hypothetical protein
MARRITNVFRLDDQASLRTKTKPTQAGSPAATANCLRGSLSRVVRWSWGDWRQDVTKGMCVDWGDLHASALASCQACRSQRRHSSDETGETRRSEGRQEGG